MLGVSPILNTDVNSWQSPNSWTRPRNSTFGKGFPLRAARAPQCAQEGESSLHQLPLPTVSGLADLGTTQPHLPFPRAVLLPWGPGGVRVIHVMSAQLGDRVKFWDP